MIHKLSGKNSYFMHRNTSKNILFNNNEVKMHIFSKKKNI